jgi:hypothetical protein
MQKTRGAPKVLIYPRGALTKDGMLEDYRVGESFAILRFKPITGEFVFPATLTAMNEIMIFVYANHGALLLKKKFGLMDSSMTG